MAARHPYALTSSAIFCLTFGHPAAAAVINVPADYPTIRQAVGAAVDGDEIVIAPGTYDEVVQTGDPSYAYLNDGNNLVNQASVMAHVCGHCEFTEINVLNDAEKDRTERVIAF